MATVDGVVAAIETGKLGDGYSVKVDDRSSDGYEMARIYVIRHGRRQCGYVYVDRDGSLDLSAVKIAGMSTASVMAALGG